MKNLKNKIKNKKGITLISLVITIIILLILAGISIAQLTGNGLFEKAKLAKDENEKITATETMNLKITNVQISKYAEEQRMPTLRELADNFCEDDDFQYVQETSKVASLTKITSNSPTSIYTKLKAYPYEFEINSSLQLASIDGVKVATVPANDDDTIVSMTKAELKSLIKSETASNWTLLKSESGHYSEETALILPANYSELLIKVGGESGYAYTFYILKDMLTSSFVGYPSGFGTLATNTGTKILIKEDAVYIDDYNNWSSTNQSTNTIISVYYK